MFAEAKPNGSHPLIQNLGLPVPFPVPNAHDHKIKLDATSTSTVSLVTSVADNINLEMRSDIDLIKIGRRCRVLCSVPKIFFFFLNDVLSVYSYPSENRSTALR